jgi:hypothetical protein
MKKFAAFFSLAFLLLFISGCTTTFAGTLLVLNFRDIILYVVIAFFLGLLIAFKSSGNSKTNFWIGFVLSLVLTPLAGLIYLLILFSRKN